MLLAAIAGSGFVIRFFHGFGPFGFFLMETLDSSYFYLPLANELLMLSFVPTTESGLMWALYVLMAAAGSSAGVLLIDLLMRKAGEKGLEKFVSAGRIKWLRKRLDEHAVWVIFIAAMLPPPFPFRAVMMTASALQSPRVKMLVAVFCGRIIRFTAEAFLIVYFGRKLIKYLQSDAFEYIVYALLIVAVIGSAVTLSKWFDPKSLIAKLRPTKAAD